MSAGLAIDHVARRRVQARASAKVNLQLSVGERGADGYHPLVTVFQAVDLYETVTAATRDDGAITLAVEAGPDFALDLSSVPVDRTNLAWRAAEAVRDAFGIVDGVDLTIVKGVPVAGGMAGGSADAAAALVACAELWDVGATRADLHELAATLGADVPFALMGHTAIGLGRGDELSPAMTRGDFHWVFALQGKGLSTPAVFARFDAQVAAGERIVAPAAVDAEVMAALMAGNAERLGAALGNDLQESALLLAPRLAAVMEAARAAGALGVVVSGSGPTVAALASSSLHSAELAEQWRRAGVADLVVEAAGPATGTVVLEG